ncbi:DUF4132 domain-containing protein [Paractinoplanes toevensis]|uniref:DUF4132 domain-containing protein n=1 Tax=Paractinoplanes toevensis TaxID=571911 RepID=A0A919W301_9ACTN|nr:DUF4132 domain-containing protein [Actinoplanes toevensis]GIM88638.1 hypothetical protein Ato02nite_004310 [Actinoplanes toevensis]
MTVLVWQDGERERWLSRAAALDHGRDEPHWVTAATGADKFSDLTPAQISWLIGKGPEASARALLATSLVSRHRQRIDLGQVAVARFGLDALPLALSEAGESADRLGVLMLPFRGPEAAVLVAGWLRHLGSARLWARLWLDRHAEEAVRVLTPAADGRPSRARQNAEDALRYLAGSASAGAAAGGAAAGGAAAGGAAVGASLPGRKGKLPGWARAGRLPEIRLCRGGTMPAGDVERLIGALSRSRLADAPEPAPGSPDDGGRPVVVESSAAAQPMVAAAEPEAAELIAGCDPASLAEFGRALFDEWLTDEMPASEAWVVPAQAHVGDDATMDRLAPQVRSWPARSRWARAIDGYAVLATGGTDVALRHLLAIEEGMSGGPNNERAIVYLTQAAATRGLTVTQLADRLTVTHGLDAGITLDYGPRTFTVVTDDQLTPYAIDAGGRRLARPPKPGVKDTDPEAYQRFLRLKKDLRSTAVAQIARLERDMLAHRLRPASDLRAVLHPHPILGPLVRRLLWGEYDREKRLVRTLRIAEDGSFADIHDSTATVDPGAQLGIVHPAELGDDLADWAQIIADYEILQPFAQVNRPIVVLTGAQRAATSLPGFGPLPTDRVAALENRQWYGNGFLSASRVHTQLAHGLPGGLTLLIELDPGVSASGYQTADKQQIIEIWVDETWSDHWQVARRIPLGACDATALSELLVELHALTTT